MITLKTWSNVKVKVTQKWYVTLCHPNMHSHSKFGFPTSRNIGDVDQAQCKFQNLGQSQGNSDTSMVRDTVIKRCMHTPNLEFLPQIL